MAANSTREDSGLGFCEAHHVGIGPQKNRGGTAGKVAKLKAGKKAA
jgi:hypothetical protein